MHIVRQYIFPTMPAKLVVIGRDILAAFNLTYDGIQGLVTLSCENQIGDVIPNVLKRNR